MDFSATLSRQSASSRDPISNTGIFSFTAHKTYPEISCSSWVPLRNCALTLVPWFLFVLLHIAFLLFFCPLLTTSLKRASKMWLQHCCFCATPCFHTVYSCGSAISLSGSIKSWHIPLRRLKILINL